MRAWAVVEYGAPLQETELPTPEPTGTEVLVEVTHCGVCHSDLHIWEGYYDLGGGKKLLMKDRGMKLPLAMGHEVVGRVAKLGPDARGVQVGDIRIVYPWVGCGVCEQCRAEQDNMCLNMRSIGILQNGGYAAYVVVPQPRHLIDPGSLDPAVAATYACSGITVYAAIKKAMQGSVAFPPTEPVVVVGAGGLGMNAIAVLKAMGHQNIISVDVSAAKREAALAAGAAKAIDGSGSGAEVTQRILDAAGGPVLAVIDLVNGSATARFAFDALRKGGRLIQVGLFGGEFSVALPVMTTKALTLQGTFVGTPKELRELVQLAQEGKLKALPVETMPQSRANDALMRLRDGKVTGRVVLRAEAA
jgi:alcohol dehydrogenase, propanol-preferring